MIRLGLDFDNTIISYEHIFHKVAFEKNLIPHNFPIKKKLIRDYLISRDSEEQFTELQSEIYGKRILEAKPTFGCIDFLKNLRKKNIELFIVSHKTKYPYRGKKYNLHNAANKWLSKNGFLDNNKLGFSKDRIYFEESKVNKVNRIKELKCTHYVDDLPEILKLIDFQCIKVLYDPQKNFAEKNSYKRIEKWSDLNYLIKI